MNDQKEIEAGPVQPCFNGDKGRTIDVPDQYLTKWKDTDPQEHAHWNAAHTEGAYAGQMAWLDPKVWDYDKKPVQDKYFVKTSSIEVGERFWNYVKVEIFTEHPFTGEMCTDPHYKIGEYVRNYDFMETFHPFHRDGQDYALYSYDYTSTRVMKLPECEDVGGEEPDGFGFCPVEYFVPCKERNSDNYYDMNGSFGFVKGCVWGDDTSMKLQYLDLSKLSEGEFSRDDRFGYHELPDGIPLEDCVDLELFSEDEEFGERLMKIATFRTFDVDRQGNVRVIWDGIGDKGEVTRASNDAVE